MTQRLVVARHAVASLPACLTGAAVRASPALRRTAQNRVIAEARALLALAPGYQLAQVRKQLSLAQRDIAATMGVSIARISQIEHGEVTSF